MREGLGRIQDCGAFKRKKTAEYVARWSAPNEEPVFDVLVANVLSEAGITWDNRPRSIYDPEQLYTALARFGADTTYERTEHMEFAEKICFKIFGKPKNHDFLKPLNDSQVIEHAIHLNKSAGMPTMGKKQDDLPYAFDRSYQILKGEKWPNPCVAYARTGFDDTTRLIWGYPFEMTILEGRFAQPLIQKFIQRSSPMAYGLYKFELGTLIQHRVVNQGIPHCLDYSKFDSTIPKELIVIAFKILSSWFTAEDMQEWGWDKVVQYFINTPIVMPDGHIYKGKVHGVPSGSYFTNLVDSVVNSLLLFAGLKELGIDLYWRNLFVMGDDSIFPLHKVLPLEELQKVLTQYNIRLNIDKSIVGTAHFVGATWVKAQPRQAVRDLATKAVNPEKYRRYNKLDLKEGARQVVYSYASAYIEGYRMIKQSNNVFGESINRLPKHGIGELTGSDQFHAEYGLKDRAEQVERAYDSTVGMRILF